MDKPFKETLKAMALGSLALAVHQGLEQAEAKIKNSNNKVDDTLLPLVDGLQAMAMALAQITARRAMQENRAAG